MREHSSKEFKSLGCILVNVYPDSFFCDFCSQAFTSNQLMHPWITVSDKNNIWVFRAFLIYLFFQLEYFFGHDWWWRTSSQRRQKYQARWLRNSHQVWLKIVLDPMRTQTFVFFACDALAAEVGRLLLSVSSGAGKLHTPSGLSPGMDLACLKPCLIIIQKEINWSHRCNNFGRECVFFRGKWSHFVFFFIIGFCWWEIFKSWDEVTIFYLCSHHD